MSDVALRPLAPATGDPTLRAQWRAARAAAMLSLGAAWVHLAYVESHWRQWWAYGAFFLAVGAGQALFVPVILRWPRTWVVLVGIAGNLAIVGMYVVSRTAGVPLGPHAHVAETAGPIDLGTTAAEIVIVGALLVIAGPRARRWIVNAVLLGGVLLWTLRLTGRLP